MPDYSPGTLLSTKDAGDMLGVGPERIRQLVTAGRLQTHIYSPLGRLYLKSDVEALLEQRQREYQERHPYGTVREQRFDKQLWRLARRAAR
jgi:Helix-turn-helix domain